MSSVKTPAKTATKPTVKSVVKPSAKAAAKVAPRKPAANAPPEPASKPVKAKAKLVRDSFTMPQADFELIAALKARAIEFRRPAKKSQLLRAGLQALHHGGHAPHREAPRPRSHHDHPPRRRPLSRGI